MVKHTATSVVTIERYIIEQERLYPEATGELSGEFADGKFFLTAAKGAAYGMLSGANVDSLYDFIQNEAGLPALIVPTV